MMCRLSIVLLGSYFIVCAADSPARQGCTSAKDKDFKFSLSSLRNLTGHWIAQLELEHDATHTSGPWMVDIDHETLRCEQGESVRIVATVSAPPRRPTNGYELVPGLGYYKMYTTGKPWIEARDTCAKDGGHLLILNSEMEAGVVRSFWRKQPKLFSDWRNGCAYIGVHDEYIEGQFLTVLGTPLNDTGYTRWAESEPGEGTSGNSVCVLRTGLLADTHGANHLAFFCEQEL